MEKEKEITQLIQQDIKEIQPPTGFTENVMHEIYAKKATVQPPLLGKLGWFIASTIFVSVIALIIVYISRTDVEIVQTENLFKQSYVPLFAFFIGLFFVLIDSFFRFRKNLSA